MRLRIPRRPALATALTAVGLVASGDARAEVLGVGPRTTFALAAKADRITTPDGNPVLLWGFSLDGPASRPQYPGPTLIVNQGAVITISLTNQLPPDVTGAIQRVSLLFPGQEQVAAACGPGPACVSGPLALEAAPGGTVTYSFTAARAGTFHYSSGTQPELQIEMGLVGALIVRPAGFTAATADGRRAYNTAASQFDQEYLFLLSEMDSRIHDAVEFFGVAAAYASGFIDRYFPNYWFINGRNAPDTMAAPGTSVLPTQPYNAMVRTYPGDRLLMRVIGGGRQLHPFHHHGNHARIIARDGHVLDSEGDLASDDDPVDLSHEVFTIQTPPGQTIDAIFTWTGKDLGWDVYGDDAMHTEKFYGDPDEGGPLLPVLPAGAPPSCDPSIARDANGLDPRTREYCADHGKPLPLILPQQLNQTFGGQWSGSPYLGTLALLPPGEGGMNPSAGFMHMWHSHTEREMTNFDVFPGGMMTMVIIELITTAPIR